MIYQFGLPAEDQFLNQPLAVAASGMVFFWPVILAAGTVLLLLIGLFVLRFFWQKKRARFRSTVFLVTIPKYRHAEESEQAPSKERIQEAVAAGEAFFSNIGGLKAQKGFMAWLKGRADEFAFEIVAEEKVIKFYVVCPTVSRDYLEQQLLAAYPDALMEEVEDYNIFSPTGFIVGSYVMLK